MENLNFIEMVCDEDLEQVIPACLSTAAATAVHTRQFCILVFFFFGEKFKPNSKMSFGKIAKIFWVSIKGWDTFVFGIPILYLG